MGLTERLMDNVITYYFIIDLTKLLFTFYYDLTWAVNNGRMMIVSLQLTSCKNHFSAISKDQGRV